MSGARGRPPVARSRRPARCGGVGAGHTLLEILVALAIVATLTALAQASYTHFLLAARRVEARAALTALAAAQERHYLRHARYAERLSPAPATGRPSDAGLTGSDDPATLHFVPHTADDHYTLAIAAAGADGYRLEARPAGSQRRDRDCALFVLDATGRRAAASANGGDETRRCWSGA